MRRATRKIYHLIRVLVRTNRLEIDKSLKRKIRATWFKVFFLERYDSRNRTANIAGFKVKFLNHFILSYLFNEIFLNSEYYFIADNDSPHIIDCGSNIGMSILYFKMLYPNSRIVAFEPGEEAYYCLEENVKNNHLTSVVMHKAAISNKEGTIDFYYDIDNVGALCMSTKQQRMPEKRRSVKASVLSKYIDQEIDFLKIDIEGAEQEVMKELSNARKLRYVKQLVIEYHHHIDRESDVFSRMLKLLEDSGFGYQIQSHLRRPLIRKQSQDILVYAYRKKSAA